MAPQPGEYQPYVVREGDTLSALAYPRSVDPSKVWNAPENASLKASRCNMDLLHPGDIVHLPAPSPVFRAAAVGSVNVFTAPPEKWSPYPGIVLAQSSSNPKIANILARVTFPWSDPVTSFSVGGAALEAGKDYFHEDRTLFFRPTGDVSGTLTGSVKFKGRPECKLAAAAAGSVAEQVESLYAQSLNVRALARAIRGRMVDAGKKSAEIDSMTHNLVLTAFYARESVIAELGKGVSDDDWEAFAESVSELPELEA